MGVIVELHSPKVTCRAMAHASSPGWYPDPDGNEGEVRYHDGVRWSEVAAPDPLLRSVPARKTWPASSIIAVALAVVPLVAWVALAPLFAGESAEALAPPSWAQLCPDGTQFVGQNVRASENLVCAYLSKIEGSDVNLRHAELMGANLQLANLSGADLSSADLTFVLAIIL